jgi:hypothetical protein
VLASYAAQRTGRASEGEVPATSMCHTRAPMQHEEKQSNGVFSHPHTSYGIAHQIRQSIVLVMSNPSSSTPVSSTRNGFGGGEANRSSAHQACLILRPPEPVFLIVRFLRHTAILVGRKKNQSPRSEPRVTTSRHENVWKDSSLRPAHSLFTLSTPAHTH